MINRTPHQLRVEQFMRLARQPLPPRPTLPDEATRMLRARLILEEAFETVAGLGFAYDPQTRGLIPAGKPSLIEIADGCADLSVVTTGCLSACGIADEPLLHAVDLNNLEKFGPGHFWREDGKLMKPADHVPPDIARVLELQSA
jgi:predicted HAD superfamily Cof-like phosphohydrolase